MLSHLNFPIVCRDRTLVLSTAVTFLQVIGLDTKSPFPSLVAETVNPLRQAAAAATITNKGLLRMTGSMPTLILMFSSPGRS